MTATTLTSNARALTNILIDRRLTARAAAAEAGLSGDLFRSLIRHDKKITLKTASKLRHTFGDDAIKFVPAQV